MKIKEGGQTQRIGEKGVIEEIVVSGRPETIELWINDSSLSYLSIDEAIMLRDSLNKAISIRVGIVNLTI